MLQLKPEHLNVKSFDDLKKAISNKANFSDSFVMVQTSPSTYLDLYHRITIINVCMSTHIGKEAIISNGRFLLQVYYSLETVTVLSHSLLIGPSDAHLSLQSLWSR